MWMLSMSSVVPYPKYAGEEVNYDLRTKKGVVSGEGSLKGPAAHVHTSKVNLGTLYAASIKAFFNDDVAPSDIILEESSIYFPERARTSAFMNSVNFAVHWAVTKAGTDYWCYPGWVAGSAEPERLPYHLVGKHWPEAREHFAASYGGTASLKVDRHSARTQPWGMRVTGSFIDEPFAGDHADQYAQVWVPDRMDLSLVRDATALGSGPAPVVPGPPVVATTTPTSDNFAASAIEERLIAMQVALADLNSIVRLSATREELMLMCHRIVNDGREMREDIGNVSVALQNRGSSRTSLGQRVIESVAIAATVGAIVK